MRGPGMTVELDDELPHHMHIIESESDDDIHDEDGYEDDHHPSPFEDDGNDGPPATATFESTEAQDDEEPILATAPRLTGDWLPLSSLMLEYKHWVNPRTSTGLSDESIKELADSIKPETVTDESGIRLGITSPLTVVRIHAANSQIVNLVIDGQRRHLAGAKLDPRGDALVPVLYADGGEPVEWTLELASKYYTQVLREGAQREGLSSFEISESAQKLRDRKNPDTGKEYTMAEISRVVHRSESWVSKMLAARKTATPKLMHSWATGALTDEQFKDLAASGGATQSKVVAQVIEAKESGSKTEARTAAKEAKEIARKEKREQKDAKKIAKASKRAAKVKPSKDQEQHELEWEPAPAPVPVPAPEVKRKPVSIAVIADLLDNAREHPPTSDYSKGVIEGLSWAFGFMDHDKLGKAWITYVSRVAEKKERAKKRT